VVVDILRISPKLTTCDMLEYHNFLAVNKNADKLEKYSSLRWRNNREYPMIYGMNYGYLFNSQNPFFRNILDRICDCEARSVTEMSISAIYH